jgi:Spy/CpxP family protein refolding chaperone
MGPGGGQNVIGIVLHELDLTDAQRQQVQEIAAESKTKLESARSAVRKAQKALDDAVINDGNEAAIRSAATALGTAQGDEAVLRAQMLIKIKAVLTSDQVAELKELLAKPMPPRQGKRCENGEPNGPPEGAPEF